LGSAAVWPAAREHQLLTPGEALRELLHDAEEGLIGFDPISPLKPHLGTAFKSVTDRLRTAIDERYRVPAWDTPDYMLEHHRIRRLTDGLAVDQQGEVSLHGRGEEKIR
jgi:hypothetical protein